MFCLSSSQINWRILGTFHLACRVSVGLVLCSNRRSLEIPPLKRPWSSRPPAGVWDPRRTAATAVSTPGAGGTPGPSTAPCSRPARSRSGLSRLARTAGRCNPEDTYNGRFSRTCRRFGNAGARRRTPGLWHWEGEGQQKTHTHTQVTPKQVWTLLWLHRALSWDITYSSIAGNRQN